MLSTDQSHFRKYLATLGVAVVGLSLSLGAYALQLTADLDVAAKDLAGLTAVARDTILARQALMRAITQATPYFMSVGALVGLAMATYGLVGWARLQAKLDEREDLSTQKLRLEIRGMTPEEQREKVSAEAAEMDSEYTTGAEVVVISPDSRSDQPEWPEVSTSGRSQPSVMEVFQLIEGTVADKLMQARGGLEWRANQVLTSPEGPRFEADLVGFRDGDVEHLVEVKLLSRQGNVRSRVVDGAVRLLQLRHVTGAQGATLLLVTRGDLIGPRTGEVISQSLVGIQHAPRVVIVPWAALSTMSPQALAQLVRPGA